MQILRCCTIVAFKISSAFGAISAPTLPPIPSPVNEGLVDISVQPKFTESETEEKESQPVVYDNECGICSIVLPKIDEHETTSPLLFENCLFHCPKNKNALYCYSCIDRWSERFIRLNSQAAFPCPDCRIDLKESIKMYKEEFIKNLLIDPKEKMFEILELILLNIDSKKVLDKIFARNIIKVGTCEKILSSIGNLRNENIKVFYNHLHTYRGLLMKLKISPNELEDICFSLKNNPKNGIPFLKHKANIIKLLSSFQIKILLRTILDIKYADNSKFIDLIKVLFEFSSGKFFLRLAKNTKECLDLSLILLNIGTIDSLQLFIKLNEPPVKYFPHLLSKIFNSISLLHKNFGQNEIIYEIIKVSINKTSNLSFQVTYFTKNLTLNLILEKEFDFLLRYFKANFIFRVVEEYLGDTEIFIKVVDFYFKNNLYFYYHDMTINQILNFLGKKYEAGDYSFKKNFEYFLATIKDVNLTYDSIENFMYPLLFACFNYNIPSYLLAPYEHHIEENMLKYSTYSSREFIQYLVASLNDIKHESKEDYQRIDLCYKFILYGDSLKKLLSVLKPESIIPALKIICQTNILILKFYIFYRPQLDTLISVILEKPERYELIKILTTHFPHEFEYLIKLSCINFTLSKRDNINNSISATAMLQLIDYLYTKAKEIPTFKSEMGKNDFDIIEYFNAEVFCLGTYEKFKTVLEKVETEVLIDFYEKIISENN